MALCLFIVPFVWNTISSWHRVVPSVYTGGSSVETTNGGFFFDREGLLSLWTREHYCSVVSEKKPLDPAAPVFAFSCSSFVVAQPQPHLLALPLGCVCFLPAQRFLLVFSDNLAPQSVHVVLCAPPLLKQ